MLGSYLIFSSLQKKQGRLNQEVNKFVHHIEKQSSKLKTLNTTLLKITPFLSYHKQKNSLVDFIKEKTSIYHLTEVEYSMLPPKIIHEDKRFAIKKTPFHLHFSMGSDDYFWDFLKDLFKNFPGMIHSHNLSIEKRYDKEKVILKGSYQLECYSLHPKNS